MDKESKMAYLRQIFTEIFGSVPKFYRAPGRVNLIGEHTDYNDGFVMPAAIDRYVWAAIANRKDRKVRIHSANYSETVTFDLDNVHPVRKGSWSDYPQGVSAMLQNAGYDIQGADILVSGDVPIGSGLSSSAAVEVAVGFAMLDQCGASVERTELAKLCQRAENEFVGMRCGLMDQFTACNGEAGRAIMLDCRSLDYESIEMPHDISLVICNTMVKHKLANSEYNSRRADCEEGGSILARSNPGIKALRDVTMHELDQRRNELPERIFWHCRHVVSENERVQRAAVALASGDVEAFGDLMYESHRSLRDDFEVSSPELNLMIQIASMQRGVIGARMTGGGFGGCTVNLVYKNAVDEFIAAISREYELRIGLAPEIYVSSAVEGVERLREARLATIEV
jgi:galactokinase